MIGTSDQSCWLAEACKLLLPPERIFADTAWTAINI